MTLLLGIQQKLLGNEFTQFQVNRPEVNSQA